MTKHDYLAALCGIDKMLTENYSDADLGVYVCDKYETIRHALKLAAIVTGEPNFDMFTEGAYHLPHSFHKESDDVVLEIFKAMIAEAQRQAEGV